MARRQTRLPRQQSPIAIERGYFGALQPIVQLMTARVSALIADLEPVFADARSDAPSAEQVRAERAARRAAELVDKYARRVEASLRPRELAAVVAQFGKRTSEFQKAQLARQVRAAASVDLNKIALVEKGIKSSVDGWIAENVTLIRTMPPVYFDDVKEQVLGAVERGTRHEVLARQMVERYQIPQNRAALIARDQVGKLYGNLNGQRQQNLGVTRYVWRTVRDNRVRDDHELRDGESFGWESPPDDGNPGEPINCRCYAEPDLSDLSALLDS